MWDLTSGNWTADSSGRNDGLYAHGDRVVMDDSHGTPAKYSPFLAVLIQPTTLIVSNNTQSYNFFNATGGNSFFGGDMMLIKRGTAQLILDPDQDTAPSSSSYTGGTRIENGELTTQFHGTGGMMGTGAVYLAGGKWSPLGMNNENGGRRHIYVEADSEINGRAGFGKTKNQIDGRLHSFTGTVLTVSGSLPLAFKIAGGTWEVHIVDDEHGYMKTVPGGQMQLLGGTLELCTTGLHTKAEYPLIDITAGGTFSGTFLQVVPASYTNRWMLDYNGTTEYPNSLVLINLAPDPEPRGPKPFYMIF